MSKSKIFEYIKKSYATVGLTLLPLFVFLLMFVPIWQDYHVNRVNVDDLIGEKLLPFSLSESINLSWSQQLILNTDCFKENCKKSYFNKTKCGHKPYFAPLSINFLAYLLLSAYIFMLFNSIIYLIDLSDLTLNTNTEGLSIELKILPKLIILLSFLSILTCFTFIALIVTKLFHYDEIFRLDDYFNYTVFSLFIIIDALVYIYESVRLRKGYSFQNKCSKDFARDQILFVDIPALVGIIIIDNILTNQLLGSSSSLAFTNAFDAMLKGLNTKTTNIPDHILFTMKYNYESVQHFFSVGSAAFAIILSQVVFILLKFKYSFRDFNGQDSYLKSFNVNLSSTDK